jgi:hypothetical protein
MGEEIAKQVYLFKSINDWTTPTLQRRGILSDKR